MHPSPYDRLEPRPVTSGEHPLWDEALAVVNKDLAATLPEQRPLQLLAVPAWEEGEPAQFLVALSSGEWHGGPLWLDRTTPAAALQEVAEAAQDTVTERLWQVWPVCSLHDLGMHVREVSGRPSWWCAGSADAKEPPHVRSAVGELDTVHPPRRPNRKRRHKRAQG
ncbi:hypothetical protein ACFZCP_35595 [Streptomyces sp. NPDC007971]|uniref:hypothetical protein n=1 Tax=Streptomyces sp. NPDC007971 TaxID=3364799 RepID=UPI0036F1302E